MIELVRKWYVNLQDLDKMWIYIKCGFRSNLVNTTHSSHIISRCVLAMMLEGLTRQSPIMPRNWSERIETALWARSFPPVSIRPWASTAPSRTPRWGRDVSQWRASMNETTKAWSKLEIWKQVHLRIPSARPFVSRRTKIAFLTSLIIYRSALRAARFCFFGAHFNSTYFWDNWRFRFSRKDSCSSQKAKNGLFRGVNTCEYLKMWYFFWVGDFWLVLVRLPLRAARPCRFPFFAPARFGDLELTGTKNKGFPQQQNTNLYWSLTSEEGRSSTTSSYCGKTLTTFSLQRLPRFYLNDRTHYCWILKESSNAPYKHHEDILAQHVIDSDSWK